MITIDPGSPLLRPPDELSGIGKIVLVPAEGRWIARVFPESGKGIASGSAYGKHGAEAFVLAVQDHYSKQGRA